MSKRKKKARGVPKNYTQAYDDANKRLKKALDSRTKKRNSFSQKWAGILPIPPTYKDDDVESARKAVRRAKEDSARTYGERPYSKKKASSAPKKKASSASKKKLISAAKANAGGRYSTGPKKASTKKPMTAAAKAATFKPVKKKAAAIATFKPVKKRPTSKAASRGRALLKKKTLRK